MPYIHCPQCKGAGWFTCQHGQRKPHQYDEGGKQYRCVAATTCFVCHGDGGWAQDVGPDANRRN